MVFNWVYGLALQPDREVGLESVHSVLPHRHATNPRLHIPQLKTDPTLNIGERTMKAVTILVVIFIFFVGSACAFQETMAPATKKQPAKAKPTVDCSTVGDATIAESVKNKLSNTPSLKDFTLTATAKDGKVTLTGSVKKATNKGLATAQTKRVPCVKGVDNQITVEGKPAVEKKKP